MKECPKCEKLAGLISQKIDDLRIVADFMKCKDDDDDYVRGQSSAFRTAASNFVDWMEEMIGVLKEENTA